MHVYLLFAIRKKIERAAPFLPMSCPGFQIVIYGWAFAKFIVVFMLLDWISYVKTEENLFEMCKTKDIFRKLGSLLLGEKFRRFFPIQACDPEN